MDIYPILIFLHVVGAVGIFVALGIEAVALTRLRAADTPAVARTWMELLTAIRRLGPIAMLTTLAAGVWMMVVRWGHQQWILATFVGLVGMVVLGGFVTRRVMRDLRQALPAETSSGLSTSFRVLSSSTALAASLQLRIAIGLGILGLMSIKPDGAGSVLVMAVAVVAGLFVRVPFSTSRSAAGTIGKESGLAPDLRAAVTLGGTTPSTGGAK